MRRLAVLISGVLVACGLAVSPYATAPAFAAQLLQDGGFESATGNPPNSPAWTEQASTGSPLCSTAICSSSGSPRSGSVWARFGGQSSSSFYNSSISQTVTIPTGTATLSYWYRNMESSFPYSATLRVQVDGTTLRTHTESSSTSSSYGQQTINVSAYANGASHTIRFLFDNNFLGNTRMLVDDVALDHTPPPTTTPTVTGVQPVSPASTTTPRVTGTAETGATVTLFSNNTCTSAPLGTGSQADFAGAGITVTVPANAATTIWARASKSGLSDSACSSTSVTYVHDSVAPALPELTGTTPGSPSQNLTPSVRGSAEPSSTVTLYTTGDCSGTPAATGSAATFAGAGLPVAVPANSTTTFRARARDVAGNTSGCSTSSISYTNDVAAPGPVVLTSVTPTSPNPSRTPSVRGTAEAGSTVRVYTTTDCTGSPAATGTAAAFADPGLTVSVGPDSTTTFRATATDVAGNVSVCSTSTQSYTNDSTAPSPVVLTSLTPASPNPSTTTVIRGTADTLTTVSLYTTADCSGTPIATGTALLFGLTGFAVTVAPNSTTTFRAKASDLAGNVSGCSASSLTYVSDSTPPPLVELTSLTPAGPSQSLNPVVRGTAEVGSTVALFTTAGCTGTPVASGPVATFSGAGFTVTVGANTTTTFRAKATDAAGNTSACSTSSLTYVHDSSAPAAVQLLSLSPASPSQVNTVTAKGTAEAGSTVRLYLGDCTGSALATGTAAAFADPGLTATVPLNQTSIIRATATDPSGNASACSSGLSYTNDRTPPALVQLTGVTPTPPNTSTTPQVSGTAEAGSTVALYATAGCTGTPLATGTAAAFADPGLTATVVLGSTTTFRATATDAAGNTSACSTSSASYTSDLLDGSFEAAVGNPPDSPFWTETDSVSGTPLCIADAPPCGAVDSQTGPRTGANYAWFGGYPDAGQQASLTQAVTFPATGPVVLTLWYKNTTVSEPYDAQLLIRVDGQTVRTIVESTTEDAAYVRFLVDLSAYADGRRHTLSLIYDNGTPRGVSNMLVDDLSLSVAAPDLRTGTPTVNPTTVPASPSASTSVLVTGTAEAGSRVRLYATASCTGTQLGVGTAEEFAAGGVRATVPPAATTTIYARASKAGQDDSFCSTSSATYRVFGPPDTAFSKAPKKKVKTRKKKAKVKLLFASPTAGATFECRVDDKPWVPCVSGKKVKLKVGKHNVSVRAVANGLRDLTPATATVKVKKKKA